MRLCKRGHEAAGKCYQCHLLRNRKYANSAKGKLGALRRIRAWRRTPRGRACVHRYSDKYRSSRRELLRSKEYAYRARRRLLGSGASQFWVRQYMNAE